MPKVKVIVNPCAGRGYGKRVVPQIHQCLTDLGVDYDLVFTEAEGHAIELARDASLAGYEIIAAAGGDGTSNEVMNGLMAASNGDPTGTMACIPAGSGNDFAFNNGVPEDIEEACRLIANGGRRTVDVGHLVIDGERTLYFDNTVGIGFDGLVSHESRKYTRVRGLALYLPVVIKTIMLTFKPFHAQLQIDDEAFEQPLMMIVLANGPREGHTFLVAPNALSDDGLLDVITVEHMTKLGMFGILPRFMAGTHLSNPKVRERRASKVSVRSKDPMYIHVDGELPCKTAHEVRAEILPQRLHIVAG